jgi:hypothetical protein
MKVKELIEKLQEFDENMEVFYDDETYWPVDVSELYKTTIYKQYNWIWGYWMTKNKWGKEMECVYIE